IAVEVAGGEAARHRLHGDVPGGGERACWACPQKRDGPGVRAADGEIGKAVAAGLHREHAEGRVAAGHDLRDAEGQLARRRLRARGGGEEEPGQRLAPPGSARTDQLQVRVREVTVSPRGEPVVSALGKAVTRLPLEMLLLRS